MGKENLVNANVQELPGRITRSRASALLTSQQMPPVKAPVQLKKRRALQINPMRAAADENNSNAGNAFLQCKRRVVLQDVTNFCCFNTTKIQVNNPLFRSYISKIIFMKENYRFYISEMITASMMISVSWCLIICKITGYISICFMKAFILF